MVSIQRSRTSIVLCTYNGARYIRAQLDSLANQTLLPFEVIISDDGSSDETLAIARLFAQEATFPVHVLENVENLGFGENFLQAALLATGEFISFCDQDDIWRADKIQKCESAFDDDRKVILTVHTARLIDGNSLPIGRFKQEIYSSETRPPLSYSPWGVFFGFTMVFRRLLLDVIPPKNRPIDYITGGPKLAHDRWILFLANLLGSTREIAEPLADYRQHGVNLFGASKQTKPFSRQRVLTNSRRYIIATEQQRVIVDELAASSMAASAGFDFHNASRFLDRALAQQRARNGVYVAGRFRGAAQWLLNLINGTYFSVSNNDFQLRAAAKDLLYLTWPEQR